MFYLVFKFLGVLIPVLLGVAFITLLERKILGLVGLRLGPFKVSLIGILQPVFDAAKLANKQVNLMSNFSFFFYYLRASFMLLRALFLWSCFFREPSPVSFKYSVLIVIIMLSFNSLNSILAGWRTFGKYSLIGRVRTVAQLISYEGVLYFLFFIFIFIYSSFRFFNFRFLGLSYFFIIFPLSFYIWLPAILAELNRTPYDFSEGERELVRGFNTEFGSSSFTLIFLAEYRNIIFLRLITYLLFFSDLYFFRLVFVFSFLIWIRSVLPRFRFDKLIILAWKFFIPFLTLFFLCCLFGCSF